MIYQFKSLDYTLSVLTPTSVRLVEDIPGESTKTITLLVPALNGTSYDIEQALPRVLSDVARSPQLKGRPERAMIFGVVNHLLDHLETA